MAKVTNNKVKVSVLVPVYNVEKFLPECLNSLVNQSLKEIEIVCINDGSTDNSLDILKDYAKGDARIVIINKKNSGYGDSMNRGIEKATGEYVGIVEPDDFVALNTFEEMYKVAKDKKAEVVKANFFDYLTEKKTDVKKSDLFLTSEVGVVINPRQCRHIFFQQPSIWSAIYERKFLNENEIRFLPSEGASYQDAGFAFKVWSAAKQVVFMNEAFLHYRNDNPNSSVKSSGKVYAVKEEYDAVEDYLKKRDLMGAFGPTLAAVRLGGYIWNMRRLEKSVAAEFAKVVEEDYARYKKLGYLDEANFVDENALFIVNNIIVKNPMMYLRLRPLYEAWDGFKQWGFKTSKRILKR